VIADAGLHRGRDPKCLGRDRPWSAALGSPYRRGMV